MPEILKPTYYKRVFFFLFIDIIVFFLFTVFAFYIRLGYEYLEPHIYDIIIFFLIFSILRILSFLIFDVYAITWRFFAFKDAVKLIFAFIIAEIVSLIFLYIFFRMNYILFFPRSIFFIEFSYSLFAIIFLRSIKRIIFYYYKRNYTDNKINVIIYGAGSGGEQIIRDLINKNTEFNPVAIIDDNKNIKGMKIHDVKVMGGLESVEKIKRNTNANAIIIAIPSIKKERLQIVYDKLKSVGFKKIMILPAVEEILNGKVSIKNIKEIDFTDLIGREAIDIDLAIGEGYLKNKTILITGAGGSIGSEIVRQIRRFNPSKIIALDIDETELFYMGNFLKDNFLGDYELYLCDIRDENAIEKLFNSKKIDIVFHAAALKHVPLCEDFPNEAVKTNIFGTYNLVKFANNKVERFVFISTDKAVNPTSIMGATKRIAEYILRGFALNSKTIFSAVRFGNVLGSRGSVIPIFKKQIEEGGPVTVTHPNMKRYFMTIPEAVLLVIKAGGFAKGGEVFILDMGKAVSIKEIAEKMIKFYGYTPYKDIKIEFTGIRPGEKLYEELLVDEEKTEKTQFNKIFMAISNFTIDSTFLDKLINDFNNNENIEELFKKYIQTFSRKI